MLSHNSQIFGDKLRRLRTTAFALLLIACMISTLVIGVGANTEAVKIIISADGSQREYLTSRSTVGAALSEAGVHLDDRDEVTPKASSRISCGMHVNVVRISERVVSQKESIKFKTILRPTSGITKRAIARSGVPGEKEVTYGILHRDGREAGCRVIKYKVTKAAVDEIVAVPRVIQTASRGGSYMRTMHMVATAYAPHACGGSRSGHAANGMRAGHGVVAVDPRVIRLGTKLYIDGYGYCVAGDVGGSIRGSRIDLGFDSYSAARRFGRRVVTVHVVH